MLFVTGTTLNVPSLMGAIMAMGVATANTVLLITFADAQRNAGRSAVDAATDAGYARLRPVCGLCTSTTGVSPDTVTVSARAPTFRSAFTVATNVEVSSMPSRLNVAKPGSANVTEYAPGRRSTMRY